MPLVKSVDAGSPAARAGLRAGDVIGSIKNRRTVRHLRFTAAIGAKSVPFYGNTLFQSLRLFSYVVFLLVGCWLVIVRPSLMTGCCSATAS